MTLPKELRKEQLETAKTTMLMNEPLGQFKPDIIIINLYDS